MRWPWPLSMLTGLSPGRKGERLAARHLRRKGFRILYRNRRVGRYEADLVAIDPDSRTLVLVEVKTRRQRPGETEAPEERIDRTKRAHLAAIAIHLRKRRDYADRPVRFDAVAVILPQRGKPVIRHIVAAFDSPF